MPFLCHNPNGVAWLRRLRSSPYVWHVSIMHNYRILGGSPSDANRCMTIYIIDAMRWYKVWNRSYVVKYVEGDFKARLDMILEFLNSYAINKMLVHIIWKYRSSHSYPICLSCTHLHDNDCTLFRCIPYPLPWLHRDPNAQSKNCFSIETWRGTHRAVWSGLSYKRAVSSKFNSQDDNSSFL